MNSGVGSETADRKHVWVTPKGARLGCVPVLRRCWRRARAAPSGCSGASQHRLLSITSSVWLIENSRGRQGRRRSRPTRVCTAGSSPPRRRPRRPVARPPSDRVLTSGRLSRAGTDAGQRNLCARRPNHGTVDCHRWLHRPTANHAPSTTTDDRPDHDHRSANDDARRPTERQAPTHHRSANDEPPTSEPTTTEAPDRRTEGADDDGGTDHESERRRRTGRRPTTTNRSARRTRHDHATTGGTSRPPAARRPRLRRLGDPSGTTTSTTTTRRRRPDDHRAHHHDDDTRSAERWADDWPAPTPR